MNIAIIGAGFTGLSSAYRLLQNGHKVTIFEKDSKPGGLAIGFKVKGWDWTLEQHYHHWFTNDSHVLNLAKELNYPFIKKRPKTSIYVDSQSFQLDSPMELIKFPKLSLLEKIRMGIILGLLHYNPFFTFLEHFKAIDVLPKLMGKKAYRLLWEPLLNAKFGKYASEISLVWFCARIRKRTPELIYPSGGFLSFAKTLADKIEQLRGNFYYNYEIINLEDNKKITVQAKTSGNKLRKFTFDKCIVTLPSHFFVKIAPQLPKEYSESLLKLKGLGAINLILRLKKQFMKDNTYWLNVCDKAPVLAIVEHTNFIDKRHYNNEHIVYLGNYLAFDHPYYSFSKERLLNEYIPFIEKINASYKESLIDYFVFKAPFAQPIVPINYSRHIPSLKTPLANTYLANIQQVYPWDRGTNYAVELGQRVADVILQN